MTAGLKSHSAHFTFMREASLMPLHMDFFVLFTGERSIAYLTDKRFFAGVTSVMCGQRILLLEGHGTSVTFIRVIFDVTIVMIF